MVHKSWSMGFSEVLFWEIEEPEIQQQHFMNNLPQNLKPGEPTSAIGSFSLGFPILFTQIFLDILNPNNQEIYREKFSGEVLCICLSIKLSASSNFVMKSEV